MKTLPVEKIITGKESSSIPTLSSMCQNEIPKQAMSMLLISPMCRCTETTWSGRNHIPIRQKEGVKACSYPASHIGAILELEATGK